MNETKKNLCRERYESLLDNMADYVATYARERPKDIALIEHDTGESITWKTFNTSVNAFAAKLISLGLKKGDIVATSLPLLKEHVYLMYACYRIGIVIAPLDLRLKTAEIQYSLNKIMPKIYFFLGKTPVADFRPMIQEVMKNSPSVKHWVQFQKESDLIITGATGILEFTKDIKKEYLRSLLTRSVKHARAAVTKRSACLIIFTTGSTGSPKPAVLCHENILVQNIGLTVAFGIEQNERMLVNLPPSHVGCVTEQLATTIYRGAVSVLLHIFDPEKSLAAIEKHRVTTIGQIPALFNMEWRLNNYHDHDLSSLRFVLYGGQAVSLEFLKKMKTMAPKMGTGLGLTETAGFCTYTDDDASIEDIAQGIGTDMPLFPISIREPMRKDGYAGNTLSPGTIGEVCFTGPQVFLGYLNDPENTAKTVSKEGVCYTGDMGYYDATGLHFSGRSKLVIKPKGYQVYPDDVVNHICRKLEGKVENVACVGVEHEVFSEAIMIFAETAAGVSLSPAEVIDCCSDIAAYSRPSHVEIIPRGGMPLNRVAKVDYLELKRWSRDIVSGLRSRGGWDA